MISNDVTISDESDQQVINKTKKRVQTFIKKHIPITRWLPTYSRFYAISDFIAGITLGLTMIPQSIAYAALAGLTPQYGLYSSFLGGFIYVFFGTIKEVSIGATSLMALVTIEYTRDMPIDFIVLLCFLAGCVEFMMGLMNLGFLVDFISLPVTSGFTSATSIIIIISQLPGLFGLKLKCENIVDLQKLYQNWGNIKLNDTLLGISCIILLLIFRKFKDLDCSQIKEKYLTGGLILEKTLWFLSVSRNAIIVFIASSITFSQDKNGNKLFATAGSVYPGLPTFALPPFSSQVGNETYSFTDMCAHLGTGIFMVPLIAVLTNVAIAKAFMRDGPVEASQEMLTLGVCNIAGSFVSSMPTCGAFTRSAVGSASGIQTPMAGIYSGTMALLALGFLTPYFGFIPKATLSAVLISAVVFLIDVNILRILWKSSKRDMVIVGGTFWICLVFNVETGLLFGTFTNALYLLYYSARPKIEVQKLKTLHGDRYVLIKPEAGLFYPAVAYLTNSVCKIARNEAKGIYPLIVDFERFQGVDYTAAKGIEKLITTFEGKSQSLMFLNVSQYVVNLIMNLSNLKNFKFIQNEDGIMDFFAKEKIPKSLTSATFATMNEVSNKCTEVEKTLPEQESLLASNQGVKSHELMPLNSSK
ncbi:sodium-independent sulfate anion transporter-like [Chelonus insularis]|uniref:sodium-independent sulfate anion transporter-like n=1 Tax=Chelonus insularis TaxID=460826 RepID=UPI00158B8A26|nr:sodium-independent sulfate anion transporter-like [Chelonus insularis]